DKSSKEPAAAPGRADFGPNEWLVDELYQRYLADPGSVDRAWWSFFADYRPRGNGTGPQPVMQEGAAAETRVPPTQAPRQRPPAGPGYGDTASAAPGPGAGSGSGPCDRGPGPGPGTRSPRHPGHPAARRR